MIASTLKTSAAALGLLVVSFGVVKAQSDQPATGTEPVASESGVAPEGRARSPEEILEEGRMTLDKMEAASDNIARMLREARKKKDVVKMLCLDDKLNQMNVAARSATDRVASIEAAVKSGNGDRARHDDAVLGALSARATELSAEANQCIGEESGVLGDSTLEITVDPDIPHEDTGAPRPPIVINRPPVAASPTA